MALIQTDGDHVVIVAGIRYRREDAAARGLIDREPDAESQKDARIAELEAQLAALEAGAGGDGDKSEPASTGDEKTEPTKEEPAADGKTRPAPPNKARSAAAK